VRVEGSTEKSIGERVETDGGKGEKGGVTYTLAMEGNPPSLTEELKDEESGVLKRGHSPKKELMAAESGMKLRSRATVGGA